VFVERGASHPVHFNQTWFLEQRKAPKQKTTAQLPVAGEFHGLLRRLRARKFDLAVGFQGYGETVCPHGLRVPRNAGAEN
jgi:hypothetical protein